MAHLVETMAYAGEVPWHGLGVKVPADLSPDQMLTQAGLDWAVEKKPAFVEIENKRILTGWNALTRSSDNSILDIVSNDWNPVQNHDAFKFFNEYCVAGDMEMHTAGSLKNGQIVWALAKVKESFELFKGDQVDSYLLFTNPHKFGQAIDVRFTPIRVVCNNTLTLSLAADTKSVVKVNHRAVFDAEKVKEMLGIATHKLAKYKEMAQFLGSKQFKEESVKDYFKVIFPSLSDQSKPHARAANIDMSRAASKAMEVLYTQPGFKYAEGTWWQPFNAVTYLTDHVLGRSSDSRLASAWYGANKNLKIKALEEAVRFAEAA